MGGVTRRCGEKSQADRGSWTDGLMMNDFLYCEGRERNDRYQSPTSVSWTCSFVSLKDAVRDDILQAFRLAHGLVFSFEGLLAVVLSPVHLWAGHEQHIAQC